MGVFNESIMVKMEFEVTMDVWGERLFPTHRKTVFFKDVGVRVKNSEYQQDTGVNMTKKRHW